MLKGTPPRLDGKTIDFSRAKPSLADSSPVPFSFMNDRVWIEVNTIRIPWIISNFIGPWCLKEMPVLQQQKISVSKYFNNSFLEFIIMKIFTSFFN